MEGFILAAGLGSRLRPLTDHLPKALVEVKGTPILQIAIERLEQAGINHIVINVHHFADMIAEFLSSRFWKARIDISDERSQLLDTGGALKHAAPLFDGSSPIVVHNVDILSDINLTKAVDQHLQQHNLATLCVSPRHTHRMLLFHDGLLSSRIDGDTLPPSGYDALAFSGVSVIAPSLFDLLPPADHPYPVIDQYIALAPCHRIASFLHPSDHWLDVGKPDSLKLAQQWSLS